MWSGQRVNAKNAFDEKVRGGVSEGAKEEAWICGHCELFSSAAAQMMGRPKAVSDFLQEDSCLDVLVSNWSCCIKREKNVVYISKDWCSWEWQVRWPQLSGGWSDSGWSAATAGRHHFLTECKLPAHTTATRIHHCQVQWPHKLKVMRRPARGATTLQVSFAVCTDGQHTHTGHNSNRRQTAE